MSKTTEVALAPAIRAARWQRRMVNAFIAVFVVAGIASGAALEYFIDWGNVDGAGIVIGVLLAAGASYAAYRAYRAFVPTPRCPVCNRRWQILDDAAFAIIDKGQCPSCRASTSRG